MKKVTLPEVVTEDLSYYIGMILGDGSLPVFSQKGHYPIQIGSVNKEYLRDVVLPLNAKLFDIETKIEKINDKRPRSKNWNTLHMVRFKSKIVYNFLKEYCEIPSGKKSNIIKTPKIIRESSQKIRSHFLAGLIDTDGGIQSKAFGFHISSKKLRDEIASMFQEVGIKSTIRNCLNKRNAKEYYQLSVSKKETKKLITILPLRNKVKVAEIGKHAGVAEPGKRANY